MKTPIILTCSGTTAAATETCRHIEASVKKAFPAHQLYWGYNTRTVARNPAGKDNMDIRHPAMILEQLAGEGYPQAIIQSLHLLPGHEFHTLHQEVRHIQQIRYQIGMPLLSSQPDYRDFIDLLTPLIAADPNQAVLLVGHGTRHPGWTAYLALESMLQHRFGNKVYVGVVEHYPVTDDIERRIQKAGFTNVLIIPFFFVAGMHFQRDVIGTAQHTWHSRLSECGLEVNVITQGIGLLPDIGNLVVRHIHEAERALMSHTPK